MMRLEVTPTLPALQGFDVASYCKSLLDRFHNPALQHRTWQIAMDGSQKLPQRLLETIRDRMAKGQPIDRLALGVAAWMRYVTGIDEKGRPIDVRDPLALRLKALADEAGPVAARLAPTLFGSETPPRASRSAQALLRAAVPPIKRGVSAEHTMTDVTFASGPRKLPWR